ncbi:hypothetical protein [Roseimaritima sediminicola]|uniref:hypothetical protein n=1 Tax=Roseimaritima sediminicola TaxID=2662066 RepID=UPI0012982CEB|nr:hypothetical protein [Roseimaritima sediminicola]
MTNKTIQLSSTCWRTPAHERNRSSLRTSSPVFHYLPIATVLMVLATCVGCVTEEELAKQKEDARSAAAREVRSQFLPQVSSLESQANRLEAELDRTREEAERIEQRALETGRLLGREEAGKEAEAKIEALRRANETKLANLEARLASEKARVAAEAEARGEQAGYVRGAAEAKEESQVALEEKTEKWRAETELKVAQTREQTAAETARRVRVETTLENNAKTWMIIGTASSGCLGFIAICAVVVGRRSNARHIALFEDINERLDKRDQVFLRLFTELANRDMGRSLEGPKSGDNKREEDNNEDGLAGALA